VTRLIDVRSLAVNREMLGTHGAILTEMSADLHRPVTLLRYGQDQAGRLPEASGTSDKPLRAILRSLAVRG
jgi:hypothetical protein